MWLRACLYTSITCTIPSLLRLFSKAIAQEQGARFAARQACNPNEEKEKDEKTKGPKANCKCVSTVSRNSLHVYVLNALDSGYWTDSLAPTSVFWRKTEWLSRHNRGMISNQKISPPHRTWPLVSITRAWEWLLSVWTRHVGPGIHRPAPSSMGQWRQEPLFGRV